MTHTSWRTDLPSLLAFSLALFFPGSHAWAALGADEGSVESDRVKMKAEMRGKTSQRAYTVHEIETPSGILIHEFISESGKVFAVTWRGPSKPDLRSLLGESFEPFIAASQERGAGSHSHLQITRPDLVVHSGGRMRAMFGRAYLPQLVPAGLDVETLE